MEFGSIRSSSQIDAPADYNRFKSLRVANIFVE